ncbi:flagellar formation protein [Clostridium sartagoforme]|uniref:Flagellar formation protein n=1 Tax=Clostridium sartagoforme TaxID=84031 RepID=A0A4V3RLI2_9CLOT|nr:MULTISPECIES: flagellar biosynthetic protein FliO [Clostridium]MBS5937376.1 FliO/MopB family protein [Clostridium sp.]TGY43800.1 flagellar formation protein [Clostridium sartagoforme]
MDFIFLLFKLIFALAVVLGLMYLSFKLSNNKISQFNEGKYIKVLERNQISKDTAIVVVKIGKKGYVLSTSINSTNKIDELSEEETFLLEEEKRMEKEKVSKQYEIAITNLKSKISRFKDKKN